MRNNIRAVIATVVLCGGLMFVGRGVAQQMNQQVRTNTNSIELVRDRADRLEVRVGQVEQIVGSRGDRLTRIEAALELQSRIIWVILSAIIAAAFVVIVERVTFKKST